MSSTITRTPGTVINLDTTHLIGLANSATFAWLSARTDSAGAVSYEIGIELPMSSGAPANDRRVYVFLIPWFRDQSGAWRAGGDGGTTTAPSGGEGSYTVTSANAIKGWSLGPMIYWVSGQTLRLAAEVPVAWAGFSLLVLNYSGAALHATNAPTITIRPITYTAS